MADLLRAARTAYLPYAPSPHAPAAQRAWVRERLLPDGGVTLAEQGGALLGVLAVSRAAGVSWIDQLHLQPGCTGRGVGLALLRHALATCPPPLRLYSFQANAGARRFYERAGFRAIAFGDGSANEEGCPDALYERAPGAAFQRRFMRCTLPSAAWAGAATGMGRSPAIDDIPALGALMHAAYQGTLDDEGESPAQAEAEVCKTFAGDYGRFRPEVSRLVDADGRLLAAALLTQFEDRPFLAFSIVHPAAQGRGLARATLAGAMQALQAAGETELRLVVTLSNTPARRLYASLGFVPEG